jgi:hypothetical protein
MTVDVHRQSDSGKMKPGSQPGANLAKSASIELPDPSWGYAIFRSHQLTLRCGPFLLEEMTSTSAAQSTDLDAKTDVSAGDSRDDPQQGREDLGSGQGAGLPAGPGDWQFRAERPNPLQVSDVTYVSTWTASSTWPSWSRCSRVGSWAGGAGLIEDDPLAGCAGAGAARASAGAGRVDSVHWHAGSR